MKIARDTWLICERSLWLTLHNPVWVVLTFLQPIVYLVLFGPLLRPIATVRGFPAGGASNVLVPGLLIQLAMFGLFAGFGLLAELRSGVIERMRVTPISRVAMLLGRSSRDVVILLCQSTLMLIVAIPFGLKVELVGAVSLLVVVALSGLVTAPFSYAMALRLRSEDALGPVMNAIALPLVLLSGILLPLSLAPEWLRNVAALNPFSHAVIAARDLLNGDAGNPEVLVGVGLLIVFAVVAIAFASRAFSRAAA